MSRFWVPVLAVIAIVFFVFNGNAQKPNIVTKDVTYKAAGTTMKGYLAYPSNSNKKHPAVIVVPEWWG